MADKSYVSLGQLVCEICTERFDSGEVLLDKRMKDSLEHKTVTGVGQCPVCKAKIDDGYIALVGVDPAKSVGSINDTKLSLKNAHRTGRIAFLRKEAAEDVFNCEFGTMNFCDDAVIDKLAEMGGMNFEDEVTKQD